MDTPARDASLLGPTCPSYTAALETRPGQGLLLAPVSVCQAPFSTASRVSLKPDSTITIRSLAIRQSDFEPPFTLRFSAPGAAGPVDVEVPSDAWSGSPTAAAFWFDLPGAGFAVPAATPGYTLELVLPAGGALPGGVFNVLVHHRSDDRRRTEKVSDPESLVQADSLLEVQWLSERGAPSRPPPR